MMLNQAFPKTVFLIHCIFQSCFEDLEY